MLLIRVCLSVALFYVGTVGLPGRLSEPAALAHKAIAIAGGLCLLAGIWTPVVAVLIAFNELAVAIPAPPLSMWMHAFLAVIGLSLAMLGPGAWSVDARLFGRKRFDFERTGGKKPYPKSGTGGPNV